jgi:hypothetical protein
MWLRGIARAKAPKCRFNLFIGSKFAALSLSEAF